VAANLDTDKWTAHHGYDGLTGSLNPMSQSTDARIPHLQLVGGKDDTVPRYTAEDYARRHPNVELIVIEDFDHACCWEEEWPGMLDRFSAMLDRK
jgi:pimeloyl-ACP methyl ester carboxylesterase